MIADGLQANGEAVALANLSWKTSLPNVNEAVPTTGMVPLSLSEYTPEGENPVTTKTLQTLNTATGKTGSGENDNNGYLHFVFYLRNASTSSDTTVSMTITQLVNTDENYTVDTNGAGISFEDLPTKAIVKNDAYANKLSKATFPNYKVDALRVLACDLETTIVGGENAGSSEASYKLAKETYLTGTNDAAVVSGGSAVDYYNEVMSTGTAAAPTLDATNTGAVAHSGTWTLNNAVTDFVTVPSDTLGDASKYVKLDFKVYLDGWDVNCYDACQGQYFKMAFQFDVQ